MTTTFNRSQIPNRMSSSISDFIPKEISIQSNTVTTSRGPVEYCGATISYRCEQTVRKVMNYTQENDKIAQPHFNCGIISISSSEISLYDEFSDILPLDYRLGCSSTDDDEIINCIRQNASVFMSDDDDDTASMEVDSSFCTRPNEWEMESMCGDSIDTEEDISSTPEWINNNDDFWKC